MVDFSAHVSMLRSNRYASNAIRTRCAARCTNARDTIFAFLCRATTRQFTWRAASLTHDPSGAFDRARSAALVAVCTVCQSADQRRIIVSDEADPVYCPLSA